MGTRKLKKKDDTIIFDLDGTLYSFKGGKFRDSKLQAKILSNAREFISAQLQVTGDEAGKILSRIFKKYGEDISIALEKEYGLNRYDYFNTVWNIPARQFVSHSKELRPMLIRICKKYDIFILSDAPKIWIDNVLRELQIDDLFSGHIISGEGNTRKGNGNAFESLVKSLNIKPQQCIVVGDQENTDIIPAKNAGMKTILVSKKEILSSADFRLKNIIHLEIALESLTL
ncbi:MAG: HAD family hydrolase [Candidatus Taylorbacteria bacterium]